MLLVTLVEATCQPSDASTPILTMNNINTNAILTLSWQSNAFVVRQNPPGTTNSWKTDMYLPHQSKFMNDIQTINKRRSFIQ